MYLADFRGYEGERFLDRALLDIRLIGIPAGVDVGMISVRKNLCEVRQLAGHRSVDLDTDLDAQPGSILAHLVQSVTTLLEGGIQVRPSWYPVGPNVHSGCSDIVRQSDVGLGLLDVLSNRRRVGRLVLEGAAKPGKLDRRVLESLADFLALGRGEGDLDLVSVGRAEL